MSEVTSPASDVCLRIPPRTGPVSSSERLRSIAATCHSTPVQRPGLYLAAAVSPRLAALGLFEVQGTGSLPNPDTLFPEPPGPSAK